MENNQNISWKEVLKTNYKAFQILYKEAPKCFHAIFASSIWDAISPYFGIYFSALIINELAGACDVGRLKTLVLWTLFVAAATTLISAYVTKLYNIYMDSYDEMFEHIYMKKLLDMDYVNLDNAEHQSLLAQIRQNQYFSGWGFRRLFWDCALMSQFVCTILGGVVMTVALFTTPVPEEAGDYTILNSPWFVLLIIAVILLVTFVSSWLKSNNTKYYVKHIQDQRTTNLLYGFFGYLGHKKEVATDVRIYEQEPMCEKYGDGKGGLWGSNGVFAKYARGQMGFFNASASAVSVMFTGVAYLFVCLKAWAGAFGIGSVTQYVMSITMVASGVSESMGILVNMKNNTPFLQIIFEFLELPNNMYQGSLTVEKRRDRKYEVEFKDVSFKYPGSENYALKNVNMKFEIGKRLAVVGMNGSGKTTFIKLLCRLYDPTEGVILLNGIDIRKYNYREYMDIFSVVFQDFKLYAFQLGENIATDLCYDKKRAAEVLEMAGFGERLEALPKGLDTYLYHDLDEEKGVDVSGGEAQKIAIARALYKDAPFIILDEPTAALDPIAEAEIYEKFDAMAGDKTAIYISHRLSSCKFCDEILVFHEGAVVQHGTHETLVADAVGKYYELWNAQAQYYVG